MYKIVIWGNGSTAEKVISLLKKENEIYAITSSFIQDIEKWKEYRYINYKELDYKEFDIILIASQYADEIEEMIINEFGNKVYYISYHEIINSILYTKLDDFIYDDLNYNGLVLGMSYAEYGIYTPYFKGNYYNLATPAQDLYYDYKVLEFIESNYKKKFKNIKHIILDLPYYFLHNNLSMRRVFIEHEHYKKYVHRLNDINQCSDFKIIRIREFFLKFKTLFDINKLLNECNKSEFEKTFIQGSFRNIDSQFVYNQDLGDIKIEDEIKIIKTFQKEYPNTKLENMKLFDMIVQLCKNNHIKLSIITFPNLLRLNPNIYSKRKKEFYKYINKYLSNYEFIKFYDLFEFPLEYKYFGDIAHLNQTGGRYITKLLINKIMESDDK